MGTRERLRYDFLVDATGPKLNFAATPRLGPAAHSLSVCTESHAAATARALDECVDRMRRGERQRLLVGTGLLEGGAFVATPTHHRSVLCHHTHTMDRVLRTFIPWQVIRVVAINLKMVRLIARSHGTHLR